MSWNEIQFGEIAAFRNGLNFSNKSHGGGCKIIGIPDFGDRSIPDYESLGEINPDGIVKNEDYLKQGDIIFVRSNGNKNLVGRSLFISSDNFKLVYSGFCIRARITSNHAVPRFYSYFFKTPLFRRLVSGAAGGANIQNLNQGILSRAIIPLPSLSIQHKIVSILSAYDNLIDNNLKRIKLLEELAQRTYEEWFVKFRVNGTQLDLNMETGLPHGWERKRTDEFCNFLNGYAYYTKGYSDSGYTVLDLGNIGMNSDLVISGKEKFIDDQLYAQTKKFHLNKYDVIIAMTDITSALAILAKTAIVDENNKYVLNQRVGCIRAKNKEFDYSVLYALFNDSRFIAKMKAVSKGAVQFYFNTKDIVEYIHILPSHDFITDFIKVYRPYLELRSNLKSQISILRQSRDTLLPRLMSGVIDVEKVKEETFAMAADPNLHHSVKK